MTAYHQAMGVIDVLASAFINTFGITQPTEKMRRQAGWFITGMLVLVLAVLAGLGVVLMHVIKA